ncbi:MAG: zf-HC2 domain-containing protein [Chloroflexi bacterium]|nr:zf-HC2 domain-containing protein [Chloroflexota bacterium]
MEHEETYLLMMEALDGELVDSDQVELEAHLRACPSCQQEWQALLAVHTLLQQAPALSPAVDFAQRTLARLPNRRTRVWALTAVYILLLLGGVLPIALGIWLAFVMRPILSEPTILSSISQSIGQAWQVMGTIAAALLSGLGQVIVQQPALLGWLLVLLGIVSVWGGVSRQLIFQPNPQRIS